MTDPTPLPLDDLVIATSGIIHGIWAAFLAD